MQISCIFHSIWFDASVLRYFFMKLLLTTLTVLALVFCSGIAQAGDVTYVGTLTGVECSGCKRTIAQSLGKMKGVQTIQIKKTGEKTHQLTVITDGSKVLTRADATAALKRAEHYKIQSWSRRG